MRLYGSIKELVAAVFRKDSHEITLKPSTAVTYSAACNVELPAKDGNAVLVSSGDIVNADIAAGAAIVDTKLATISTAGKVSNSATTATSANTASAIVARDASGDFTAGTITASLSGNASTATTATSFSGSLSGEVTGTQSATVVADDVIDNANIKSNAAIVDTKLATISTAGKVSGGAITSGTIGGTTSVNTTGSVSANTLTSSSTTTAMQVYINGAGNNGFLELEGQTVSGVAAPTVGEARLFAGTDGKIYVRKAGSAQAEELGAGGSGEINLVDNSSDAGEWGVVNATATTNTTAANNPLSGTIDTSIAIASSTSGGYARYRFSMPAALKQRKLKLEWYQIAASLASGDYRVEVYTNASSDYSGAYTELALSTDSSGNSPIPNLNGKYSTTFDTTSADYYEIRVVRTAASAATLYIANVVCGPGIQPQGAVVGEWQSYTGVISGGGTAAFSYSNRQWRRVGTNVEILFTFTVTANGSGGGAVDIAIPSGLTIDYAKAPTEAVIGTYTRYNGSTYDAASQLRTTSSLPGMQLLLPGSNRRYVGTDLVNGYTFYIQATVPIAEWAGSGTLTVAQNDVEYLSNSDTSTSVSNTSSFAYGPAGQSIVAVSSTGAWVRKRVQVQAGSWSNKGTPTVKVSSDGVLWLDAKDVFPANQISGKFYGIDIQPVSASSTTVDVAFGGDGATSTQAWSAFTSYKWRVDVAAPGQAVGFGIVSPGVSSGLVSASGLPGRTNGVAIPSGYVGQLVPFTGSNVTATATTHVVAGSVSLPAGIWLLFGTAGLSEAAGPAQVTLGFSTTTNSFSYGSHAVTTMTNNTQQQAYSAPVTTVTLSSTTTINFVVYRWTSSYSANGNNLFALRIA